MFQCKSGRLVTTPFSRTLSRVSTPVHQTPSPAHVQYYPGGTEVTRLMRTYGQALDSLVAKVAAWHGVDPERARKVFQRTLRTYQGTAVSEDRAYDEEESRSILLFTEVMVAGYYLSIGDLLELFATADLDDLVRRQIFAIHWSRPDPFLYTPHELAERYSALHRFLVRNSESLLATGYPVHFEASEWELRSSPKWWALMHLYPTRVPSCIAARPDANGRLTYWWGDDVGPMSQGYDDAARFPWLPADMEICLKFLRTKILHLNTRVAECMTNAILLPPHVDLWDDIRQAILDEGSPKSERLTSDEVKILLGTDEVYARRDAELRCVHPNEEPTVLDCLSHIILMVGLSDWMRTSEQARAIRAALDRSGLVDQNPMGVRRLSVASYYEIVGTPAQGGFDEAVDLFRSDPKTCEEFRDAHQRRVHRFLGQDVPVKVQAWMLAPPKHAERAQAILDSACEAQATSLRHFDRPAPINVVLGEDHDRDESATPASILRSAFVRNPEGSWEISFGGKTIHPPDSLGLRYIQELLRRPNRPIDVLDLFATVRGVHGDQGLTASSDDEEIEEQDADVCRKREGDFQVNQQADKKTIDEVRGEIEDLGDQMRDALEKDDLDRAQSLDQERAKLEKYLKTNTGLRNRPRGFTDERERARKSVSAAIRTAKEMARTSLPELGTHLDAGIKTGFECCYAPQSQVEWEF